MLPDMNITGIVENDTIKLPIHVPDGTSVEKLLRGAQVAAGRQAAAECEVTRLYVDVAARGSVKTLPPDFAENGR